VAVTGIQSFTSNIDLSINLNGLANLATAVSDAYDNTTTGFMTMEVQFSVTIPLTGGVATSRTPYIYLYLLKSVDGGTTYDDADINNAELLRVQWTRAASTNASNQYFGSVLVDSVPQFFKFMIYNATGDVICIARPKAITSGPDGNLWVNDGYEQRLWKVTTAGAISWHNSQDAVTFGITIPPSASTNVTLGDITVGSDGNLWVSDFYSFRLWEVTTTPAFTGYAPIASHPISVCDGTAIDGNVWTCDELGYVWKVTTAGAATPYLLSLAAPLSGICTGSDGNFWVCARDGYVWQVTPAGTATAYLIGGILTGICDGWDGNLWAADATGFIWSITTGGSGTSYALTGGTPTGICRGSDFNHWLSDPAASGQVWQVTTGGVATAFSLGSLAIPTGITNGPDANLWVSDIIGKVWKVTTAGTPTSYTLAVSNCEPMGICEGPIDGHVWVADAGGASLGKVWKVDMSGVPTVYFLGSAPYGYGTPRSVTRCLGDFKMYVADYANHIMQVTTAGAVTQFNLIPFVNPKTLCETSDSNLWLADGIGDYIWKIDITTGLPIWYLQLPSAIIWDICLGPDGNLWVADGNSQVWQVTNAGVATAYSLPFSTPYGICSGPDGNLWVADGVSAVWKVTTGGSGTSYAAGGLFPRAICEGPDGLLWVTDATDKVFKITTGGSISATYTLTGANLNDTTNICEGPDGNLWVNDYNGKVWKLTTSGVGTPYTLIVDTVITVSGKYDTYS